MLPGTDQTGFPPSGAGRRVALTCVPALGPARSWRWGRRRQLGEKTLHRGRMRAIGGQGLSQHPRGHIHRGSAEFGAQLGQDLRTLRLQVAGPGGDDPVPFLLRGAARLREDLLPSGAACARIRAASPRACDNPAVYRSKAS